MAAAAGRLAFSEDGVRWHFARTAPFNGTIVFTNGSTVVLARMERPVLVVDDTFRPTHLINGVQPRAGDDRTFTLIQPVKTDDRNAVQQRRHQIVCNHYIALQP